ncbi:MAG: insulinase family protein [Spirochaetaceae bacterium]|jgi:Zn-dependent M16 (insulinase) family peptidase|nr:insulinase family protein [Spirochaetaceae bacterium]
MNTIHLQRGDVTGSGFEILDTVSLPELDACGVYARHIKTGAEVFHVYNDDTENTFAFAFKTLPEDSSGVFHIIEHSVLCGSERFPIKDAFIVLAQGSLQTYLNAWTFPDKTVYPASSVNENDYFNLMNVYGDAVFRPNLAEWTFLQEGRRFEFKKTEDGNSAAQELQINGVVYNEMKGAYSALDEYAQQWAVKSVLPDTLYAFDSGGDPACIPELSYEDFIRFHKKYYCPANTKVFLCGNIPTEKQLAFLNDNFFNTLAAGEKAPDIPPLPRWKEQRRLRAASPAGAGSKATVFISWLCNEIDFSAPDGEDAPYRALVWDVLCELLLGHDAAPLARAMVASGLGEDLANVCGLEDEIKFHIFTAGLRGVKNEKKADKIEKCIMGELKKLAAKGIPKDDIEAALFAEEFSEREIKRSSGGPWALALLRRSLRGWLHGGMPWRTLVVKDDFERLKNELRRDSRYFEGFIRRELLENPHRARVVVQPEESFSRQKESEYKSYIQKKSQSLTDVQKNYILEKTAELERVQNETESPETLAAIPHLSLKDLDDRISLIPRDMHDAGGTAVVSQKLRTNGVVYISMAFPVDTLSADDFIYLPLFTSCINAMGAAGKDWARVSRELACNVGEFYAALYAGSTPGFSSVSRAVPGGIIPAGERIWIIYTFKTLDEKLAKAFDIVTSLMRGADFSDKRRLKNIILEMRNTALASLAPAGTYLAAMRSGRVRGRAGALNELWHGITQLNFVNTLPDLAIKKTARRLEAIRDVIAHTSGCIACITSDNPEQHLSLIEKHIRPFGALSYPRPAEAQTPEAGRFSQVMPPPASGRGGTEAAGKLQGAERLGKAYDITMPYAVKLKSAMEGRFEPLSGGGQRVEVFASQTLSVGFSALSVSAADRRTKESAADAALAHYLSTGSLWENLRMKCGAYGANCSVNQQTDTVNFSTYRDPKPYVSIRAMPEILYTLAQNPPEGDALEKTIIGAYSKIKQPMTSAKKGALDFLRFLNGIDDTFRQRSLDNLLTVDSAGIKNAAVRIQNEMSQAGMPSICIVCGAEEAEKAAAEFGVPVQSLPV